MVLGSVFIAASIAKLSHRVDFIGVVTSYNILPDSLAQSYGFMLPWAELIIGCLLILGLLPRFAAGISIPLITSFIVFSAYAIFHGVEGSCGCFGQIMPVEHSGAL